MSSAPSCHNPHTLYLSTTHLQWINSACVITHITPRPYILMRQKIIKKDHTAWIQLTYAGATFAWCSAAELTVTAAEWKHSCLRCISTRQQPTAHDCSGGQYIQTATVLQRMKKACLVLMETLTAGSAPIRITWAEEQQILCYSSSCRSAVCIFMLKRVLNYASSRV